MVNKTGFSQTFNVNDKASNLFEYRHVFFGESQGRYMLLSSRLTEGGSSLLHSPLVRSFNNSASIEKLSKNPTRIRMKLCNLGFPD